MTHTPVLLQTVIKEFDARDGDRYIDATIGEGGHARALLQKKTRVLGIDWDQSQIENLKTIFKDEPRLKLVQGNFANIAEIAKKNKFYPVDGILFDLGLSYRQLKTGGRGFSYRLSKEELDMRIDINRPVSAKDIIHTYSEEKLYEMLAKNSEEINARKIAQLIVLRRKRIKYVSDLVETIDYTLGRKDNSTYSRVFQALRVEVNGEFAMLKKGLIGSLSILKPKGKIAVITFHSVEDRIVKQFMKTHRLKQLTKQLVKGDREKSFERSAKLRIMSII